MIWLGMQATGTRTVKLAWISRFMATAMILLPALGMLSTVVGILSVGNVPQHTVKAIIFGPTGIGILGYLMATSFHALSDSLDEKHG